MVGLANKLFLIAALAATAARAGIYSDYSWTSCGQRLASVLKLYDGGAGPKVDLKAFKQEAHQVLSAFLGRELPSLESLLWFQDSLVTVTHASKDIEDEVTDASALFYTVRLAESILDKSYSKMGLRLALAMHADGTRAPMLLEIIDGAIRARYRIDRVILGINHSSDERDMKAFLQLFSQQFAGLKFKVTADDNLIVDTDDVENFFKIISFVEKFPEQVVSTSFVMIDKVGDLGDGTVRSIQISQGERLDVRTTKILDFAKHRIFSQQQFPKLN